MIRGRVSSRLAFGRIRKAVRQHNIRSLARAGATVRLIAKRSIRQRKKASTPGLPPNTRKGALRRAILFAVERSRQRVIIGPDRRFVGRSGAAHEFGGRYRRERYPRRPFMGPALLKVRNRLPRAWQVRGYSR